MFKTRALAVLGLAPILLSAAHARTLEEVQDCMRDNLPERSSIQTVDTNMMSEETPKTTCIHF